MLFPSDSALSPGGAALYGALIGAGASLSGVLLTQLLTFWRDWLKERRTSAALLSVIESEANSVAEISVRRRNSLSELLTTAIPIPGKAAALLEIPTIKAVEQDPSLLGLLSGSVVSELFGLSSSMAEINRIVGIWSNDRPTDLMSAEDVEMLRKMFVRLLSQANNLAGLAEWKQKGLLGRAIILFGNIYLVIINKLRRPLAPEHPPHDLQ